jgi:Sigma-70, region 4
MAAYSSGTVTATNPGPAPPAALPGRALGEGLAGLDDLALLRLVQSLPRASARRAAACELLVSRYEGLVRSCVRPLAQQLGRTPADSDLARQAQAAFQPSSLDAPQAGQDAMFTLADTLGWEDPRLEHVLGMQAVAAHWGELPAREQQILIMDFRGGMTQTQFAQRLSISQMHVSRLRAHALGHLRARLLGPEPYVVPGPARRQHPASRMTMTAA